MKDEGRKMKDEGDLASNHARAGDRAHAHGCI